MAKDGDAGDNGHRGGFTEGIERIWGFEMAFEGYPTVALYDRRKVNAYGNFIFSMGYGIAGSWNECSLTASSHIGTAGAEGF